MVNVVLSYYSFLAVHEDEQKKIGKYYYFNLNVPHLLEHYQKVYFLTLLYECLRRNIKKSIQ